MARRSFLRGRPGSGIAPLRPPWALAEAEFTTLCTRCGECVDICPTGLLTGNRDVFPQADFALGHCDFCGRCVDTCRPGALTRIVTPPWHLTATIGIACLAHQGVVCRSCGDACDAAAIRFRPRAGGVALPELDAIACTGCGECLPICPSAAITMTRSAAQEENP